MIRVYSVGKTLHPRHVFRISRGSRPRVDNVFLVLEQDGILGYGEASPNSFFNEYSSDVLMGLIGLSDYFRRQTLTGAADIARIWDEIRKRVAPSRACQCAVDLALWDLLSKAMGKTASECILGKSARPIPTSATLGICPPEEWPGRIDEVAGFPAVKVKMGAEVDLALLQAIRNRTDAALRIDANGAWSELDIPGECGRLAEMGVEFLEQPLPPSEDTRMESVLREANLPILADESCRGPEDVERLPGRFSGFNIKLVKCGGLTPALEMIRLGRKLDLKIMVGCMLESSLLISAGAVAAQEADYADLDGSWLLADDPFRGLRITGGHLQPSSLPGFGVQPMLPPD